jgi:hypothetical protein
MYHASSAHDVTNRRYHIQANSYPATPQYSKMLAWFKFIHVVFHVYGSFYQEVDPKAILSNIPVKGPKS